MNKRARQQLRLHKKNTRDIPDPAFIHASTQEVQRWLLAYVEARSDELDEYFRVRPGVEYHGALAGK